MQCFTVLRLGRSSASQKSRTILMTGHQDAWRCLNGWFLNSHNSIGTLLHFYPQLWQHDCCLPLPCILAQTIVIGMTTLDYAANILTRIIVDAGRPSKRNLK
jgi:hypothetical protein